MLFEIFLFLFLGILAGTLSGFLPGIHINLIGTILIAISSKDFFSSVNPIYFVIFIVAMAIAHTFIDFIPSIFLGAVEEDTALSALPGHQLLQEGKGFQAVKLAVQGALAGVIIFFIISMPLSMITPKIYSIIDPIIPFLLIIVSLFLIFSDGKKISALFVFLFSGILGVIILNLDSLKEPLLPLLTGLFGASSILIGINQKVKIPKQETEKEIFVNKKPLLIRGILASPISIFLPAFGSGQIAIIGNLFSKKQREDFLFLLGTINSLAMSFSFLALYTIQKTRTGSAVAVQQLLGTISTKAFVSIIFVILISGLISFYLSIFLAKHSVKILEKINYTKLSIGILLFISIITVLVSGFFGFLILIISTATGAYCISLNVRRTQMMGCLLLPTIFLYLS